MTSTEFLSKVEEKGFDFKFHQYYTYEDDISNGYIHIKFGNTSVRMHVYDDGEIVTIFHDKKEDIRYYHEWGMDQLDEIVEELKRGI